MFVILGILSLNEMNTQRQRARVILKERGIVRLSDFIDKNITGSTVARMVNDGEVNRLDRGIYQLSDADLEYQHSLAEVAVRVPNSVVCLISALAYHELTVQYPRWVWIAIGNKKWKPRTGNPPIRVVRFSDKYLNEDFIVERIEGVPVKIFGVAKTIADCFRHRSKIGHDVALEGLQEALRQKKATPAEIADQALKGRVFNIVFPYIEALTANS